MGAKSRLEDLFREGWLSQPRRMLQRPGMLRTAFEAMTSSEATATVYCVLTPARWNHHMEPPQAATLGSHFVYVVQSIVARVYTHQNPPDLEWAPRHCLAVVTKAS